MQQGLLDRVPVQALEQQRVLALHVGEKLPAAARMGRRHGEADQRGADRPDPAIVGGHREARAPPHSGLLLVDADGPDHLVEGDGEGRDRDDRDRHLIERVAIVTDEDLLLVAEHAAP
jgi:hypothetical protein